MNLPWIDDKYVMLLSGHVDRFKVISHSPLQVNFRCPICGDSKKSKTKARGYVYRVPDGSVLFKCHNCSEGTTLRKLLKIVNTRLFEEYSSEYFRQDPAKRSFTESADRSREAVPNDAPRQREPVGLVRLSDLPKEHDAVVYWGGRSIPAQRMGDAWWTDSYFAWVNANVIPEKFSVGAVRHDAGRIVFPLRDAQKNISGYTGRSIRGEEPKYVAIKIAGEGVPMAAFGMDRIDTTHDVLVLEGPIDSLFLPNAVAMGTSNRRLDGIPKRVMIYDNEPRSPQLVGIMSKSIAAGEKIVIWPDIPEKDVNEMVLAGRRPLEIIKRRTFRGLQARMEFAAWKRC